MNGLRFRKKPVVIEAFRWAADRDQDEDPEWIVSAIHAGIVFFRDVGTEHVKLVIATLEGHMVADRGDWIIRGVQGELYPCKPDIFAETYEPADAEVVVGRKLGNVTASIAQLEHARRINKPRRGWCQRGLL